MICKRKPKKEWKGDWIGDKKKFYVQDDLPRKRWNGTKLRRRKKENQIIQGKRV